MVTDGMQHKHKKVGKEGWEGHKRAGAHVHASQAFGGSVPGSSDRPGNIYLPILPISADRLKQQAAGIRGWKGGLQ